jgi:hypothetical protein
VTINDHPRVFLPAEGDGGFNIAYGYLFIKDGVPYLAATLEDARAGYPAIPTPLDPQLLEEQPSTVQGEQPDRLYRGRISRS